MIQTARDQAARMEEALRYPTWQYWRAFIFHGALMASTAAFAAYALHRFETGDGAFWIMITAAAAALAFIWSLRTFLSTRSLYLGRNDEVRLRHDESIEIVRRGKSRVIPIAEIAGLQEIPHETPAYSRYRVHLENGEVIEFSPPLWDLDALDENLFSQECAIAIEDRINKTLDRGGEVEMRYAVPPRRETLTDVWLFTAFSMAALAYVAYQYFTEGRIAESGVPLMLGAVVGPVCVIIWYALVRRHQKTGVVLNRRGIRMIGEGEEDVLNWVDIEEVRDEDYSTILVADPEEQSMAIGHAAVNGILAQSIINERIGRAFEDMMGE